MSKRTVVPTKLERMYKRILESAIDRGKPIEEATRLAAATVNKFRARRARGRVVCAPAGRGKSRCHVERGPQLVAEGGSRRGQWWPGKGGQAENYCATHRRGFKSRAALLAHYRGSAHAKRASAKR